MKQCMRSHMYCEAVTYSQTPALQATKPAPEGTSQAQGCSSLQLTNATIKTFLCAGSDTCSFAKCPLPAEFSYNSKEKSFEILNMIFYGTVSIHFSTQEQGRERTFLMPKDLSDARCGSLSQHFSNS